MDKRDAELLDRQLWGISPSPPQSSASIGLTIVVVFLAGMAVGNVFFAQKSESVLTRDTIALISAQNGARPMMR
jgi:hypothetical protein